MTTTPAVKSKTTTTKTTKSIVCLAGWWLLLLFSSLDNTWTHYGRAIVFVMVAFSLPFPWCNKKMTRQRTMETESHLHRWMMMIPSTETRFVHKYIKFDGDRFFFSSFSYPSPSPIHNKLWTFSLLRPLLSFFLCLLVKKRGDCVSHFVWRVRTRTVFFLSSSLFFFFFFFSFIFLLY
jgi:hypothetical protein